MKKVLLFVFMFLLAFPVKGLENDMNTIRKYKYYRLNKVMGPMVLKNEVNNEYPLIDEKNYILDDLSELSVDKPSEMDGRKIYEYDGFHYLKIPGVNSLVITPEHDTILYDIEIKKTNGESIYKSEDILNNISKTYKLNEDINLNDLVVECKGGDNRESQLFTIDFKYDDKIIGKLGVNSFLNNIAVYGRQSEIKKDAYENIYSLTELSLNDYLIYNGQVKLYQYQDYKYQSYRLDREYYNEYLTEPFEDYIYRDENDFIDVPINTVDNIEDNIEESITEPVSNDSLKQVSVSKENNVNKTIDNNTVSKKIQESHKNILETPAQSKSVAPVQYAQALKINKNTPSNKMTDNNVYYYFLLAILIILLIIAFKIRNKLKEYQRW